MADMYSYSGVKLPVLPEFPDGCGYGIIFYDEEDSCYYLFCSSEKFLYDEDKYMIPATASYGGYAAKEGASYWNGATFTPSESEETPDYYFVANTGNISWSSVEICQKDTETVVYKTTKPLQYPTITFTGSSKLYRVGAEADALVCDATVGDGGTLSWAWYEGETVVGTESSFTPPTDAVSEKSYFCVVTNTTEGQSLTTTSSTVTIQVKELFPIREFVSWLLPALSSHPLPVSVREPVTWLYNGVRLPGLPEWDRETYLYAYIGYSKLSHRYALKLLTDIAYTSDGTGMYYDYDYGYRNGDVGWTDNGESTREEAYDIDSVIWANFDVIGSAGTVLVEASNPIPVYE